MSGRLHKEPFAQIPDRFLRNLELSDRAVRVLGVLHRYADRENRAFPSRARLAEDLGCSLDSVKRALKELSDVEAIVIEPRYREDGSRAASDYWLWPAVPPGAALHPTGGTSAPTPGADVPPTPVQDRPGARCTGAPTREREPAEREPDEVNPPTPQPLPSVAERFFEAFWVEYPRKVSKDAARRAWGRAVRRAGGPAPILAGVKRFAIDPNLPDDRQFIPHPATWLNGGRWDDEPLPPRARSELSRTERNVESIRAGVSLAFGDEEVFRDQGGNRSHPAAPERGVPPRARTG